MATEINSTLICPVCANRDCASWTQKKWKIPSILKEFSYLACENCQTVFCNPMPTGEDLALYYGNYFDYGWYERRLTLKKMQAMHRWRRMRCLFKKHGIGRGKLLDVGCGHGMFVRAAQQAGWTALGLDYPSKATRHAKNILGLNIVEDELIAACKSGKVIEAQFDFITAWHCLEHSSIPVDFLKCAAKLLKPGGKMLLAVPNVHAHGMKRMGEDWAWCQQPFVHVVHFNGKSLAHAARCAGLNVVATWSRDTWDANRKYDEGLNVKVHSFIYHFFGRRPKISFLLEEGARILFYGLGCSPHWLLGRECKEMDGSELLLLAERPI